MKPFYSSKIDRLDLKARGIRWPGPFVQNLVLDMQGLQGATLDVRGSIAPGNSKLDVKLVELPLAPFNPYVTASGYSLAGGTLSFDSQAKVARRRATTPRAPSSSPSSTSAAPRAIRCSSRISASRSRSRSGC